MTQKPPASTPVSDHSNLSVVVSARNEQDSVIAVLTDLRIAFPGAQLILVDNGSSDGTAEAVRALQELITVQLVTEDRPGKGNAMRAGAAVATRDWLLFHDADDEYLAEDCVDVVRAAEKVGTWAVGTRFVSYANILVSSWLANQVIRALLRWRTGFDAVDVLSGTRCLPRRTFAELSTTSKGFAIETEITRKLLLSKGGPAVAGIRFHPRTRARGKKIRPWHLLLLFREALKLR